VPNRYPTADAERIRRKPYGDENTCRWPTASVMGIGTVAWALVVRGAVSLDLGIGRRYRTLGPIVVRITASRETVFDVIAEPYLSRTPRSLKSKLEVLERGTDVVLAAHFTPAYGLTATTIETVRFERPERVHFRLVRGPVPHALGRSSFARCRRDDCLRGARTDLC
jgi:hypothetical protein